MRNRLTIIAVSILLGMSAGSIAGQTTAFTFQGRLLDNTLPPTAPYDFEFRLFDAASGGSELGVVARPNVSVNSGVFSVMLDFGSQFDGAPRFLQIAVKPAGSPDPILVLDPRQPISSSPYSIRSLNAASADAAVNAAQLGGVAAGQYVVTTDFRLSNERAPAPGSQNYIQNSAVVQNLAEFNIGGTGKAGTFDAVDGYQIEGQKILDITGNTGTFLGLSAGINNTGSANTFAGAESGAANTIGFNNSYFGYRSGNANATGRDNSFFGFRTGFSNTGPQNSFFGSTAGQSNTTGNNNSFFGERSGQANSIGSGNSFVGARAGFLNTTGGANSFFGLAAGAENTTGFQNAFFGFQSGFHNFDGSMNVFIGWNAGFPNVSGINNTFVGQSAGVGNTTGSHNLALGSGSGFTQTGLTFATAVGPGTRVSTNNTIQLGRITQEERVLIPGDLQVNGAITGSFTVSAGNITGVLSSANGGTGLASAGSSGSFLRSNGTTWTSSAILAADLPAGNSNYIQNSVGQQAGAANFNISGSGQANIFNSGTQYNLGNNRILSSPGTLNTFVGINNGLAITSGERNTFVGRNTGVNTTTGSTNTFVGSGAGFENISGSNNSFYGYNSGLRVTSGSRNAFFGVSAGSGDLTGNDNSFFGYESGLLATGNDNSFFGAGSGRSNTTATGNSFFGRNAGRNNMTGSVNSFFGRGAGEDNTTGLSNSFFGEGAGQGNTSGLGNSFLGVNAGFRNTTGNNNSALGHLANVAEGNLEFATAIGAGSEVSTSNTIRLGRLGGVDRVSIPGHLAVSGGIQVSGGATISSFDAGEILIATNLVGIRILDDGLVYARQTNGGTDHVCTAFVTIQGGGSLPVLSSCSSSRRYKNNILDFTPGSSILDALRPVTFNWKSDGRYDLGLVAEEVAEIEPLLVTRNEKGEVEGVKYDRIGVVLINVVKEQQKQIEELKSIVCELKPDANACRQ